MAPGSWAERIFLVLIKFKVELNKQFFLIVFSKLAITTLGGNFWLAVLLFFQTPGTRNPGQLSKINVSS